MHRQLPLTKTFWALVARISYENILLISLLMPKFFSKDSSIKRRRTKSKTTH